MRIKLKNGYSRAIPPENNAKMICSTVATVAGMFFYGILLPYDWEQRFGLFAHPIRWVAHAVPAIGKLAAVSTIPELLIGFTGLAALVAPIYGLLLVWWAFFDCTQEQQIRLILKPPYYPLIIIIFYEIFALFCIYYFYINPFPVDSACGGHNWGNMVCARMLKSPFGLAFYGAIVTAGVGVIWGSALACFIRAIGLLVQEGDEDGNND